MASTSAPKKSDVVSNLSKLSIDANAKSSKPKTAKTKSKKAVADSWEDEDMSGSDSAGEQEPVEALPSAPPPTPISPAYNSSQHFASISDTAQTWRADVSASPPSRRPEKTDAVARRMIASALGVKVPKQTEEQKAYDRAVREQEKKRRDEERAAEEKRSEEAEKAKAAIWDD